MILGGAKLIAIHKSRYFKAEDGLVLGPGEKNNMNRAIIFDF